MIKIYNRVHLREVLPHLTITHLADCWQSFLSQNRKIVFPMYMYFAMQWK